MWTKPLGLKGLLSLKLDEVVEENSNTVHPPPTRRFPEISESSSKNGGNVLNVTKPWEKRETADLLKQGRSKLVPGPSNERRIFVLIASAVFKITLVYV